MCIFNNLLHILLTTIISKKHKNKIYKLYNIINV